MMDKRLLSILCCPVTHKGLKPADDAVLGRLNAAIATRPVTNREGATIESPLDAGLVTDDDKWLYPVADGIPVLLEGEAIALDSAD